jgi:magnesium-transporting ATPase (P-type)
MLLLLSVCHTIVIDERKGTYNAASPDELALVNGAKQFGYEFKGIDKEDNMLIEDHANKTVLQYKLLNVCEFNSTRKRASVIVRDPKGQIVLMCKGADSVIYERLSVESLNSQVLKSNTDYVNAYAQEGLRTLYCAEKIISQADYDEWNAKATAAKLEISGREEKVSAVDELIETELELIGATAIEDRLQDKVADTIQFMKHAGVKVWVLTGDKIETAVNIGFSAGLLDNNMTQHSV